MRMMTKKQETILEQVMKLADGDPLVVERALRDFENKQDSTFKEFALHVRDLARQNKHAA